MGKEIIKSGWITPSGIGGYKGTKIYDSGLVCNFVADFIENKEVIKKLKEHFIQEVHLAGNWENFGYYGYGQKVKISEIENII